MQKKLYLCTAKVLHSKFVYKNQHRYEKEISELSTHPVCLHIGDGRRCDLYHHSAVPRAYF